MATWTKNRRRQDEIIPLKSEESDDDEKSPRHPSGRLRRSGSGAYHFFCAVFVIAFSLAVVFVGGLFTGYGAICSRVICRTPCVCNNATGPNWGGRAKLNGKKVSILQVLDKELKPENVKKYLRFGL